MGGCATKPKVLKGDEREVQAPVPPPEPTKEPVPAVSEAKEAADVIAECEKKVEVDVAHEVLNDDKVDDQENKRQSLSYLFKEREKKGSAKSENTPSEPTQSESLEPLQQEPLEAVKQELLEPVKQESVEPLKTESLAPVQTESVEPVKHELLEPENQASSDTEKLKGAYVTMSQETEEPAKPVDHTHEPEPVPISPGNIASGQSVEAKEAPEAEAAVNVPETENKETSADDKEGKTERAKFSLNSNVELSVTYEE